MLKVDIPDVLAELEATFEAYERALTGNDIETLNSLFWGTARRPCGMALVRPSGR